jgi:hypothetical protein
MRKKLLLILLMSIFLALLGVHFQSPGNIEFQRTSRPLHSAEFGVDKKVPPVVAQPELPKSGSAPSENGDAPGVGSSVPSWNSGVPDLIKKTFQAASSRRPPIPPTRRDLQRTNLQVGGSNQQESPNGSISKANSLRNPKAGPGISVRCNTSLPSCRRWLFLQKKKSRRQKTLAVKKISE